MEKLKARKLNNLKVFTAFYVCTLLIGLYGQM